MPHVKLRHGTRIIGQRGQSPRVYKEVKGKDGKEAKTREVKLAALFAGSLKKGRPCRDEDSTTYVATAARWEDFGRMARREFDRRFPRSVTTWRLSLHKFSGPPTCLYIRKWLPH